MPAYVALLRAVNVGGTGKLPMSELRAMCADEGFEKVQTANPFPDKPPNWTVAIFLDDPPPVDALDMAKGRADEDICLGKREIYVAYGAGIGCSRLKIPAAANGTARNINTIRKLAELAAEA